MEINLIKTNNFIKNVKSCYYVKHQSYVIGCKNLLTNVDPLRFNL